MDIRNFLRKRTSDDDQWNDYKKQRRHIQDTGEAEITHDEAKKNDDDVTTKKQKSVSSDGVGQMPVSDEDDDARDLTSNGESDNGDFEPRPRHRSEDVIVDTDSDSGDDNDNVNVDFSSNDDEDDSDDPGRRRRQSGADAG